MKLTFRILGIPVVSLSLSSEGEDVTDYISNLGGSFDFAPDEAYEDEEHYEEDRGGFGFGVT